MDSMQPMAVAVVTRSHTATSNVGVGYTGGDYIFFGTMEYYSGTRLLWHKTMFTNVLKNKYRRVQTGFVPI